MSIVTNTAYHLTRSSYRRKIITFGVSIFASLSLIATGFASWVLSSGTTESADGNVQVGVVQDGAITATDIAFTDDNNTFSFNPEKDDTTGRVRWDKAAWDANNTLVNYESMSITFSTTVTNIQSIKTLTVGMTIPESVQDAVNANYIVLPDCADGTVDVVFAEGSSATASKTGTNWTWTVDEDDAAKATLSYTITFEWGSAFGGKNPGDYYDTDPTGMAVDFDTVRTTLHRFRATMFGWNEVDDNDPNTDENTFEEYLALTPAQQEDLSFAADAFLVTVDIQSK